MVKAATADSGLLAWENHAPWLVKISQPDVIAWQLVGFKGPWAPAPGTRTLTDWVALFLAEAINRDASTAAHWVARWRTLIDRKLADAERSLIDFASWWAVQFAQDRLVSTGSADASSFTVDGIVDQPKFREAESILERLAELNRMPSAPPGPLTITHLTANCLERDAGVLWRVWLTNAVPAYELPALTLWSTDPVTARWNATSGANEQLSVLVGPAPFVGSVTVGWVAPSTVLQSPQLKNQVGELLKVE